MSKDTKFLSHMRSAVRVAVEKELERGDYKGVSDEKRIRICDSVARNCWDNVYYTVKQKLIQEVGLEQDRED